MSGDELKAVTPDALAAPADALMGRNEYARHRGCAPNAVKKAEDDGRIAAAVVRSASGDFVGIKWLLADELWARHTDPMEAAKNGKVNIPPLALDVPPPAPPQGFDELPAQRSGEDVHGYFSARADKERYAAERARIDLLERVGLVVSAQDTTDRIFDAVRRVRDTLLLIAPKISQRLASETDPMRCESLINEQHRIVLNELSRAFAVDATGGVGERAESGT